MKKLFYLLISVVFFISCTPQVTDVDDDKKPDKVISLDTLNTTMPLQTVKLCFIHHSTGSAWIGIDDGLGELLNANNYYATECDYGWDAETNDNLGDRTDTVNWPEWFTDTKMPYVYANNSHFDYDNTLAEPAGENEVIMFKSCYPSSEVGDSITDEKDIYNGLLTYFNDHTSDKMFILVIPPPEIEISSAALTRELSNWLVDRKNGWLKNYTGNNVYAFNYYNVLTDPKNHHWVNSSGKEENIVSQTPTDAANPDELYYYTGSDSHPTDAGHKKAAAEFIKLLNGWYNKWKSSI